MLWSAVYLPGSSPSTPIEESCIPYPTTDSTAEEPPHCRLPKTRSFDDLPTACDLTAACVHRRSSDPSLNEKWQDRLSLELNGLAISAEGQEGDRLPLGAELSMAAGVGEGQMENILQEASKEEGGGEEQTGKLVNREVDRCIEKLEKTQEEPENEGPYMKGDTVEGDVAESESLMPGQLSEEIDHPEHKTEQSEQSVQAEFANLVYEPGEKQSQTSEESSHSEGNEKCGENNLNGKLQSNPTDGPTNLPSQLVMEESTETLTDDHSSSWSSQLDHVTAANELSQKPQQILEEGIVLMGLCALQSQNERTCSVLIHSAFPPSECNAQTLCNRDQSLPPILDGPCLGVDNQGKQTLSHQNSSSDNPQIHIRNIPHKCPLHSCGRHRIGSTPEQPVRNHLDDDGMPLYVDAIQQRLRQMESGHQQEVETLKKQVQELRCRLESHLHNGQLQFNGEYTDEVTSIPDSESNRDPSCLSGYSTEPFSEASWEQVDKRDTEMTRWLPDHLAVNCYNCDGKFWLASRKHHCRNCGNVFCSSCCNQKVPVPSQQLFEPSRVCKSCYGNLHSSLELENPITASSN